MIHKIWHNACSLQSKGIKLKLYKKLKSHLIIDRTYTSERTVHLMLLSAIPLNWCGWLDESPNQTPALFSQFSLLSNDEVTDNGLNGIALGASLTFM